MARIGEVELVDVNQRALEAMEVAGGPDKWLAHVGIDALAFHTWSEVAAGLRHGFGSDVGVRALTCWAFQNGWIAHALYGGANDEKEDEDAG